METLDKSKETLSAYLDASLAEATKKAAKDRDQKTSAWIAIAITERLEREGKLPSQVTAEEAVANAATATAEISGPDAVLKALKALRRRTTRERAAV